MRVEVNYRKEEKQMKKIVLHLKSILTRALIYDRAYPEIHPTASPGNPTKPSSFLLFVQQEKKFLEVDKGGGNLFFDNFGQFIHEKKSLTVLTCIKLTVVHLA